MTNFEAGLEAAVDEIAAVQRAIAADNLDRCAAYNHRANARKILESHAHNATGPQLMAAE